MIVGQTCLLAIEQLVEEGITRVHAEVPLPRLRRNRRRRQRHQESRQYYVAKFHKSPPHDSGYERAAVVSRAASGPLLTSPSRGREECFAGSLPNLVKPSGIGG